MSWSWETKLFGQQQESWGFSTQPSSSSSWAFAPVDTGSWGSSSSSSWGSSGSSSSWAFSPVSGNSSSWSFSTSVTSQAASYAFGTTPYSNSFEPPRQPNWGGDPDLLHGVQWRSPSSGSEPNFLYSSNSLFTRPKLRR